MHCCKDGYGHNLRKDGHAKMIKKFRDERADFLVGTDDCKGHDFPLVTLVGVINADSLINLQDYRAQEKRTSY